VRFSARGWCTIQKGKLQPGHLRYVQTYVATLAEERGFNIDGIDQRYAYREAPTQPATSSGPGGLSSSCCTLIIILFIVALVLSSLRKGGKETGLSQYVSAELAAQ